MITVIFSYVKIHILLNKFSWIFLELKMGLMKVLPDYKKNLGK